MAKNKSASNADKYGVAREVNPQPQSGVPSAERIRVTNESEERQRSMAAMFEKWEAEEKEGKKM